MKTVVFKNTAGTLRETYRVSNIIYELKDYKRYDSCEVRPIP